MTEIKDVVDVYTLRARVFPALLVTMPAGIAVAILLPGFDYKNLTALALAAGLPIFAANATRSRGRRLEQRLISQWGALPTTLMLRLTEPTSNTLLRARRRRRLEQLTGEILPTADRETTDPAAADEHYTAATRTLIARVRETKDRFDLVQRENIDYGFRRNLTALKPVGLLVLAILSAVDLFALWHGSPARDVIIVGVINTLCLIGWLTVVRTKWVREQADTYAERLFETLDDPSLIPSSTAVPAKEDE